MTNVVQLFPPTSALSLDDVKEILEAERQSTNGNRHACFEGVGPRPHSGTNNVQLFSQRRD